MIRQILAVAWPHPPPPEHIAGDPAAPRNRGPIRAGTSSRSIHWAQISMSRRQGL